MKAANTKNTEPLFSSPSLSASEILNHLESFHQLLAPFTREDIAHLPFTRRLKLQPLIRESQSDPFHRVPGLTLCGEWLKSAGFKENTHVRILSLRELLVIFPEAVPPQKPR